MIRPIILCGTYNYKLAKYIDSILKPLLDESETIVTDTFDFVNKIADLNPTDHPYMVSFNVVSLFTCIPTLETIDIILDRVYNKKTRVFHNLKRDELKRLLIICAQESHFQFNDEYYDQVDGLAMGSPLGPLFANIFMSHLEKKHMGTPKKLGVLMWKRYVDDVFAIVKDKQSARTCLEFLNKLHKNIEFTIEHEQNNQLAFLDTYVKRGSDRYFTTMYHKKTFTGVYLQNRSD